MVLVKKTREGDDKKELQRPTTVAKVAYINEEELQRPTMIWLGLSSGGIVALAKAQRRKMTGLQGGREIGRRRLLRAARREGEGVLGFSFRVTRKDRFI